MLSSGRKARNVKLTPICNISAKNTFRFYLEVETEDLGTEKEEIPHDAGISPPQENRAKLDEPCVLRHGAFDPLLFAAGDAAAAGELTVRMHLFHSAFELCERLRLLSSQRHQADAAAGAAAKCKYLLPRTASVDLPALSSGRDRLLRLFQFSAA